MPLETTGEKKTKKTKNDKKEPKNDKKDEHGLPESFRILTLFDKKFQSLWKPQVKKNKKDEKEPKKDKKDERAARVFSDSHSL